MDIGQEPLRKTLHLLVMLLHSRQQFSHGLSEEEKATLHFTKKILNDAGLTVPEFSNCLHKLSKKGYIWHFTFYDEYLRSQINDFISSPEYEKVIEELRNKDTAENSAKLKNAILEDFKRFIPSGVVVNPDDFDEEEISISQAFEEGIEHYKKLRPDQLGGVILMPFRDIHKLLERIENKEKFEDIQDDGFWFSVENYEFHIDSIVVKTRYNNKPNKEHEVLKQLFIKPDLRKVYYEDLSTFSLSGDESKELASFRDACARFIQKHPKLKLLFTAHINYLEFHPERYEQTR